MRTVYVKFWDGICRSRSGTTRIKQKVALVYLHTTFIAIFNKKFITVSSFFHLLPQEKKSNINQSEKIH